MSRRVPLQCHGLTLLGQIAVAVLVLSLAFGVLQFCRYGWDVIACPYPVDYGEGPLLDQLGRLSRGENIYKRDLTAFPFTIANYPPLYLLVQIPLETWFGPAFWYGRALSWISTLAACACIALTVHALTRDRLAAVISGLLLLVMPHVLAWSPLYRVDTLALALSWGGLFVIARWAEQRWALRLSAGLLLAAIFTRQSYALAAPFAAFIWLLQQRSHYPAWMLVAWVGGGTLGLSMILNTLTQGGFLFNTVTANANRFQTETLVRRAFELVAMLPLLWGLACVFLIFGSHRRTPVWWLATAYFIGATLSGATIGKIGSNVNYLLEMCAALSLITGISWAWVRRERPTSTKECAHRLWGALAMILPFALSAQIVLMAVSDSSYARTIRWQVSNQFEQELLLDIITLTDGPILTDQHMGLLALARRPIYHQPFEMRQLAADGAWDQTPFLNALKQHYFTRILLWKPPGFPLEERRWTPEMLKSIETYYQPIHTVGVTVIYAPHE